MYENIGKKIKSLAKTSCLASIGVYVIAAIMCMCEGSDEMIFTGIGVLIIGPALAYATSFLMYGFGELIDKTCDIERNTRGDTTKSQTQASKDRVRIDRLEAMRSKNLISEEEFQAALAKEN